MELAPKTDNQRSWERQTYQTRIGLRLDGGPSLEGASQDVSLNGLLFKPDGVPKGVEIGMSGNVHALDDRDDVFFSCEVVRLTEEMIGVNFQGDQASFGMFISHAMMLDLLVGINNSLAQSEDLDTTLTAGVDHMRRHLQSEAVSLFLLENDDQDLVCKACSGPVDVTGLRLNPGEGIVGRTIVEGRTLIVHDVKNDSRFAGRIDEETGYRTESIICAPLSIQGRCFGAIEVLNKQGSGLYAGHDRVVLTALASATALAIHGAKGSH